MSQCIKCRKACHYRCLEQNLCKFCIKILNVSPKSQSCSEHFDPFIIEEDGEHDYFFDDDINNSNHTTKIAKNILMNCKYHNSESLPLSKLSSTTFYFNNIDGFKTNFSEFSTNRILHNHDFHFYCFNETNIHENCTEKFEIEG